MRSLSAWVRPGRLPGEDRVVEVGRRVALGRILLVVLAAAACRRCQRPDSAGDDRARQVVDRCDRHLPEHARAAVSIFRHRFRGRRRHAGRDKCPCHPGVARTGGRPGATGGVAAGQRSFARRRPQADPRRHRRRARSRLDEDGRAGDAAAQPAGLRDRGGRRQPAVHRVSDRWRARALPGHPPGDDRCHRAGGHSVCQRPEARSEVGAPAARMRRSRSSSSTPRRFRATAAVRCTTRPPAKSSAS